MTVNELIKKLFNIPERYREQEIVIYGNLWSEDCGNYTNAKEFKFSPYEDLISHRAKTVWDNNHELISTETWFRLTAYQKHEN